jgi:hypothetical protein
MTKKILAALILLITTNYMYAQTNFSGTWSEPELEMVDGIQYSNALPNLIKVIQTKDSIMLERTTIANDGNTTATETFPLNGKKVIRVTKTSKRTITTTATWSDGGKVLTIISIYSYSEKPTEIEYKNTEIWTRSDEGSLMIVKTSDATVTDDWTIKGTYQKS